MGKRFWGCGVVVSFASLLLSFLTHALLLGADYEALGPMYRGAADGRLHAAWLLLAHALLGFAMTWVFFHGFVHERPTIVQGLRFGLGMALFSTVPGYLIHYAVQPLPPSLVAKQIIFGIVSMLLLGALLAWLQPRRRTLADPH